MVKAWAGGAFDRVIVFDLDDTLYLERDYVLSGLKAVGDWAIANLALHGLGTAMIDRFEVGYRTRLFDEALIELGFHPSERLITRMLAVYRQHRPDIRLADDAAAFLARRHPRTAFAVITDGFLDAQKRKIRALNLYRRGIHLGICTDRWGREGWKPNQRAFRHIESIFGLSGMKYTYVADNPTKDFHAPISLQWDTVRIARPQRMHIAPSGDLIDAARVIEKFGEF